MAKRPLNILFFVQQGRNSRSFLLDFLVGVDSAGHRAMKIELDPIWTDLRRVNDNPYARLKMMEDASSKALAAIKGQHIDLTVGMWANAVTTFAGASENDRVVSFFEKHQIPHLMLWWDAPQWAHEGSGPAMCRSGVFKGEHLYSLINNASTAEEMTSVMGFRHAMALPYAVSETTFKPDPALPMAQREFDLAFSCGPGDGAPSRVMLEELGRDEPDVARIRKDESARVRTELHALAERAPTALRAGVAELLSHLVEVQLAHRDVPVLKKIEGVVSFQPRLGDAAAALKADPALYAGATGKLREIDSWQRAFTFAFLSRHLKCVLFGDADLGAWGCRVKSIGYVAHEMQGAVYSRARTGLSVMRWQDDVGVNLKPFEITASGSVCLMGHRVGVEEVFEPRKEIVLFRTPSEALSSARELLANPGKLDAISAAGRARTLRDHTWKTRAAQIIDRVGEASGKW